MLAFALTSKSRASFYARSKKTSVQCVDEAFESHHGAGSQTAAQTIPVAGDDAAADAVDPAAAAHPCRARTLHRRGDRAQPAAGAGRAAGRGGRRAAAEKRGRA